ncbi:MAG: efflux RND transporter periplasmic adaptor subunit [Anaerolineae bacterium]
MERLRRIIPVIVLLILVGGGYYLYTNNLLPFLPNAGAANDTVSGFIEGTDVSLVPEVGGRIDSLSVDEGDRVTAGQELVKLDHSLLDAQIAQAQAAVDTARAQLTQIKNGARPSDVTAARAALDAAQKNYDKVRGGATESDLAAAQAALNAAQQNYDRVRTGPTRDQLAALKAQVDNARAVRDQAQAAYDKVGGLSNPNIAMMPQSTQLQTATNNYNAALATYSDALSHPTASELAAAQSQVQQAQAVLDRLTPDATQLAAAQSQVQQAQGALDRLTPTADAIAVAEAQVKQAEAALAVLQVQLTKMTLKSPVNGIVTRRSFHQGEVASPGNAILTVVDLDPVTLTVYVPETQIGHIQLGMNTRVQVDSFPGKTFQGKVILIGSQAEFTPRNVQSKEERVNTVFAVKVELANPGLDLKPGMPADAGLVSPAQ